MASAEKLLHEAQYAFASITFGESLGNKRNAARATTLSRKIIRQFPGSTEASEAHAILRRLGEEAYVSKLATRHVHQLQAEKHRPRETQRRARRPQPQRDTTITSMEEVVSLDWAAMLRWLRSRPASMLFVIAIGVLFLAGLFGYFIFLPLIGLVLFTGPFRKTLNLEQREALDNVVKRVNAFVGAQQ